MQKRDGFTETRVLKMELQERRTFRGLVRWRLEEEEEDNQDTQKSIFECQSMKQMACNGMI